MSSISLKVELPSHSHSFHIQVPSGSAIRDIKEEIFKTCTGSPRAEGQKIIWRGRVLSDEERVDNIWKSPDEPRVIHLAVHYSAWTSSPPETPATPLSTGTPSTSSISLTRNQPIRLYPTSIPYAHSSQFQPQSQIGYPLAYVSFKHNLALSALASGHQQPTAPINIQAARQMAIATVERCGWSWPSILDEEFPQTMNENTGLQYANVTLQGQNYLSLVTANAAPTALQAHALKVLSYTFPILLAPAQYPSGLGAYTNVQAYAIHGSVADVNLHLQQMGLPQIHANNNGPPLMPQLPDIPIRALLAPLIMLGLRTLLLLYFVSPARKPFIGLVIGAWVVYEAWGAVRVALGYDGLREGNANRGGDVAAGAAPQQQRGAAGGNGNGQRQPAQNPMQPAAGAPARPQSQLARPRTHTDIVIDHMATINLEFEEQALEAAAGARVPAEPGLTYKLRTFVSLLLVTLHPEVWNRRRARLRQREGRIRTEANVREPASGNGNGEGEANVEQDERQAQARAVLVAQHRRRPIWVRRYIEVVRRSEWSDE